MQFKESKKSLVKHFHEKRFFYNYLLCLTMNPRERYLAVFDEDARQDLDQVPTFTQGVKPRFYQKYEEELFGDMDFGQLTYNLKFDPPIALGFDSVFGGIPSSVKVKQTEMTDEKGNKHKVGLSGQVGKKGSTFYNKGLLFNQDNLDNLKANTQKFDNSEAIKQTIDLYEEVSDKIFPVVMVGGIFDRVWMGMQMKYFSRHYRKKTKLYKDIVKFYAQVMKWNVEGLIEATGGRAGVVNILDDVAFKGRLMISPERWEEDYGPHYKEICDIISDAGMIPQVHTDGDVTELIESFQKVGFRGLQGWEGGVDPYYVNENFPDFVVIGFGDVSHVIPHGTKDEIEEHVKELMDALKENRHYIFGPSTVVQADDPLENVRYFMECGKRYGQY